MNWFSKHAQDAAIDEDQYLEELMRKYRELPPDYQSATHMNFPGNKERYKKKEQESEHGCEEYMWIYKDGKIDAREVIGTEIHSHVWSEHELFNAYSGRYNTCDDLITFTAPRLKNTGYERIPSNLPRLLQNYFSGTAHIVWYHDKMTDDEGSNRTILARGCGKTCKIG